MAGRRFSKASHFIWIIAEEMRSAAISIMIMMTGIAAALVFVSSQSKPAATRVFLPEAMTAALSHGQQTTAATAR
jgi:hypothetical protein